VRQPYVIVNFIPPVREYELGLLVLCTIMMTPVMDEGRISSLTPVFAQTVVARDGYSFMNFFPGIQGAKKLIRRILADQSIPVIGSNANVSIWICN
jgi:hypothetical protein